MSIENTIIVFKVPGINSLLGTDIWKEAVSFLVPLQIVSCRSFLYPWTEMQMQCDRYVELTKRNTLNSLNEIWTGCSGVLVLSNFLYVTLLYHNQHAPLFLFSHILSSHILISYSMEIFPLTMDARSFKWLDVSSKGSFSYGEQREEEKTIWKQKHVESGNRRVYIKEAYLRKISVLRKKGDQVEDEPVLYCVSCFSEEILTAFFAGRIPFLIQVQHISLNAGQSASCMQAEGRRYLFLAVNVQKCRFTVCNIFTVVQSCSMENNRFNSPEENGKDYWF